MDWLHRFLVPSERNGYRPTGLERAASGVMLLLILLTFAMANVQSILLVSSDWFIGSILPAALVDMTNDNREDNELPELSRNKTLDVAAQKKAEHMAKEGYFAHDSPDGVTPWHWFQEVGYEYAYAGENLAVHFSDSEDVVEAWMESPGHRANILGKNYAEIGIGTAKGTYKGSPTVFVVQLFGTPREVESRALAVAPVVETPTYRVQTETPEVAERAPVEVVPPPQEEVPEEITPATPTPETEVVREVETTGGEEEVAPAMDALPPPLRTSHDETLPTASEPSVPETTVVETAKGKVMFSDMATSVGPSIGAARPGNFSTTPTNPVISFLNRLLTSPHTFLSLSYLILAFVVTTMLSLSVIIEWRRQHPVQVAYAVGLAGVMFLALKLHLALTTGALIT